MSLSYRNQSIDLDRKSNNWFLYDRDLQHERVKRGFWENLAIKSCNQDPANIKDGELYNNNLTPWTQGVN